MDNGRLLDALLRNSLSAFIQKTFATVDPGTPYSHNWHIDLIAEYLEACTRREIRRLIINIPPRYLKSIAVTVGWPAWLLGRNPAERIIAASYAHTLSLKHSIDTRLVIKSDWYNRIFPATRLVDDQDTKQKFVTTERGMRYATSVLGSAIGEGGDFLICLPYDSMISTEQGLISIGDIVSKKLAVKVLSYDHGSETEEYMPIEAYETNPGRELYEIDYDGGTLRCTGDHPVYIQGKGYIRAGEIEPGDVVLVSEVPEGI